MKNYHGDTEYTEKEMKMNKEKEKNNFVILRDLRASVVKEVLYS
jgi:hypothetical protein